MSKRTASVQLTADNAEEEDCSVEEAGAFELASKAEIESRVIKTAKRGRTLDGSSASSLGLFSNLKSLTGLNSAGLSLAAGNFSSPSTSQGLSSLSSQVTPLLLSGSKSSPSFSGISSGSIPSNGSYTDQLRTLNVNVSEWISKHVQENPYVDLTPIFTDYKNHLTTINTKYKNVVDTPQSSGELSASANNSHKSDDSHLTSSQKSQDSHVTGTVDTEKKKATEGVVCTEDVKMDSGRSSSSSSQQSSQYSQEIPSEALQATPPEKSAEGDDDDDSLFSVRTKLFYKKEGEYVELGIGTLKVQSSAGKSVRLLLRNDSSLRSIMLNVKVTADMPLSTNQKSVLLVCPTPNPPLSVGNGPVTYLMRLKNADSAQQLADAIKTNTKN